MKILANGILARDNSVSAKVYTEREPPAFSR
jgi:hypothetical protein